MSQNDWPPREVELSEKRLLELRDVVDRLAPGIDGDVADYVVPELSRFLVVRSAGHLEIVVHQCFLCFAQRYCDPILVPYVQGTHKSWEKTKPENLTRLLDKLSPKLKASFSAFLKEDDLGSNLGSLVDKRGVVAHGGNETITFRAALNHCGHALKCASWFLDAFKPNGEADKIAGRSIGPVVEPANPTGAQDTV